MIAMKRWATLGTAILFASATLGAQAGALRVTMSFDASAPASQFPPPAIFAVQVACTGRPPLTVSLTSPAFQQLVPNIAAGSSCTATELAPVGTNIPARCHWVTTYPKGQTAQIPSGSVSIVVHNALECGKSVPTGSLRVRKTIVNATGAALVMPTKFGMVVSCTPSGLYLLSVPPGSVGTTVAGIPAPRQCTVAERVPAPISGVKACKTGTASWSAVTSPAQPVRIKANAMTNVAVRNTLHCD